MLTHTPKGYRFPASIIDYCIFFYHRFSLSYWGIEEIMAKRGVRVGYESVREWCLKFSRKSYSVLIKREHKHSDKWQLDEMNIRINGTKYILWRAVESEGYELDIFIQNRRNKKAITRFFKRLMGPNPAPRVIVTDKLRSYNQPIKTLSKKTNHRRHKGLNNRAENAHQLHMTARKIDHQNEAGIYCTAHAGFIWHYAQFVLGGYWSIYKVSSTEKSNSEAGFCHLGLSFSTSALQLEKTGCDFLTLEGMKIYCRIC